MYDVGQRVIAVSNENEPAKVGTIVGAEKMHSHNDSTDYVVMGILLPYRQDHRYRT